MPSIKITSTMLDSIICILVLSLPTQSPACGSDQFIDPSTNRCVSCNTRVSDCSRCTIHSDSSVTCDNCWGTFVKTSPDKCQSCWELGLIGCYQCNDNNTPGHYQCTQCDFQRRLLNNGTCIPCAIFGCKKCIDSISVCTQCLDNFAKQSDTLCKQDCDSNECMYCPNALTMCEVCVSGFYVASDNTCKRICSINDCEYCPMFANVCANCQEGFHLNTTENLCIPCTIHYCSKCGNKPSECETCTLGFFVRSSDNSCKRICDDDRCFYCPNQANECTQCHQYLFQLPNKTCAQICGDSFVLYSECDLPLGISNDGCTDQCKVELGYQCDNEKVSTVDASVYGTAEVKKSKCSFFASGSNGFMKFVSSDKSSYPWENKVGLVFQLSMLLPQPESGENMKKLFAFNDSVLSIETISFDRSTMRVAITMAYSEDIQGRPFELLFRPSAYIAPIFSNTPSAEFQWLIKNDSLTLRAYYYSNGLFTISELIITLSILVCVLALITCFAGAFSTKLSGLEIMFPVQYTWLMILWLPSYLPLPTYMTHYLRFASGYNIPFVPSNEISAAPQTFVFGLSSESFASNYNLGLIFTVAPLVFVFGCKLAHRRTIQTEKKKKIHQRFIFALQLLMYGCFFSLQYFFSCAVIYFKAGNLLNHLSLAVMAFQISIYVATAIRFIYKPTSFNRFRFQFNDTQLRYNHYAFHFLNLVGSVLLLSLLPNYPWAPAVPQLLLLLYTFINSPYKTVKENMRSIFYMVLMLNATAFKTYIWYVQPDHHSVPQYAWLIIMQLALIIGVFWAIYELWKSCKKQTEVHNPRKDIKQRYFLTILKHYNQNSQATHRLLMDYDVIWDYEHIGEPSRQSQQLKKLEDKLTQSEIQQIKMQVKEHLRLKKALQFSENYKGEINKQHLEEFDKIEWQYNEMAEMQKQEAMKEEKQAQQHAQQLAPKPQRKTKSQRRRQRIQQRMTASKLWKPEEIATPMGTWVISDRPIYFSSDAI